MSPADADGPGAVRVPRHRFVRIPRHVRGRAYRRSGVGPRASRSAATIHLRMALSDTP